MKHHGDSCDTDSSVDGPLHQRYVEHADGSVGQRCNDNDYVVPSEFHDEVSSGCNRTDDERAGAELAQHREANCVAGDDCNDCIYNCYDSESESSMDMIPDIVAISTGTTNIASQYEHTQQQQHHRTDHHRQQHLGEGTPGAHAVAGTGSTTSGSGYQNDDLTEVSSVTGLTRDTLGYDEMEDTKERYRRQLAIRMYQDEAHDSSSNHPMSPNPRAASLSSVSSSPPQGKSPKKLIAGLVGDGLSHTSNGIDAVDTNNKVLGFMQPEHVRVSYSNSYRNSRLLQSLQPECQSSSTMIKELNLKKEILGSSVMDVGNRINTETISPSLGSLPVAEMVVESEIEEDEEAAAYPSGKKKDGFVDESAVTKLFQNEAKDSSSSSFRSDSTSSAMVVAVSPLESFALATPAGIGRRNSDETDKTSTTSKEFKATHWGQKLLQQHCPVIVSLVALLSVVVLIIVLAVSGAFSATPDTSNPPIRGSIGSPNVSEPTSQDPNAASPIIPAGESTSHDSVEWVPMGSDISCILYGQTDEQDNLLAASQQRQDNRLGTSVAMSSDGRIVAIGSPGSRNDTGHVQVHEWSESLNEWIVRGQVLTGSNEQDQFGISVDLGQDGTVLAIGAIGHNSNVGQVQVYRWASIVRGGGFVGQWLPKGSALEGRPPSTTSRNGSNFGRSVSLSADGNTLAVGASQWDVSLPNAIADSDEYAEVYRYDEATQDWKQRGGDLPHPLAENADGLGMGASVSLTDDGLTCSVGIPRFFNGIGVNSRYLYDDKVDQWEVFSREGLNELRQRVNIGDHYGADVALTGDGRYGCVRAGAGVLRIGYLSESGDYVQLDLEAHDVGKYVNGDVDVDHLQATRPLYGGSLAITHTDDQQVIVASGGYDKTNEESHPGAVTIHSYVPNLDTNVGTWTLIGSPLSGNTPGDRFGDSVSISKDGSTIAVGASRGIKTKNPEGTADGRTGGYVRIFRASIRA